MYNRHHIIDGVSQELGFCGEKRSARAAADMNSTPGYSHMYCIRRSSINILLGLPIQNGCMVKTNDFPK